MTTWISPAMTTALNTYYRNVRSHLACPRQEADRLIAQSRRLAEDFILNHPGLDFADVVEFLGPPKDLANSFLETMDPSILHAYHKKRKRTRCVFIVLVIAIFALLAWYVHCSMRFRADSQITQEITTIIYEDSSNTATPNNTEQTKLIGGTHE